MATTSFDIRKGARALVKAAPEFAEIVKHGEPFPAEFPRARSPFQSLMRTIIFQQLSGKAAATIHGRVLNLFPTKGQATPKNFSKLKDQAVRACGVSGNKLLALRDLSAHALRGDLPGWAALERMADQEVIERLVAIRGIGVWTAQMVLLFQLSRPDVWPVGDLGVRKGFALLHEIEVPTEKAMHDLGEHLSPWRSIASWYCWRAVDMQRGFGTWRDLPEENSKSANAKSAKAKKPKRSAFGCKKD